MSWENEIYAPDFKNTPTPHNKSKSKNSSNKKANNSKLKNNSTKKANNSKPTSGLKNKSRSKSASKNKSQSPDESGVLTYENKGLTSFPDTDPDWSSAKILFMQSNNLEFLDASKLPRNLELLDLRNNKISKIKGEFPETLTTLWLDENQLSQIPSIPLTIKSFTYDGNPIIEKNILQNTFNTNKNKKHILWFSSDNNTSKFNDTDIDNFNIKFNSNESFNNIKASVQRLLNTNITCRAKLGKEYVINAINDAENIILEILNDNIVGIGLFNITSMIINIDMVCSNQTNKGGGSRIMNMIFSYFNNHLEYTKITLKSLTGARSFYEAKGFKPCIQGETCPMEYVKPTP